MVYPIINGFAQLPTHLPVFKGLNTMKSEGMSQYWNTSAGFDSFNNQLLALILGYFELRPGWECGDASKMLLASL